MARLPRFLFLLLEKLNLTILFDPWHSVSRQREGIAAVAKRRHTMDWKTKEPPLPTTSSSGCSSRAVEKRSSLDEGCSSRSESVKNLIEQVKNTLKAIESDISSENNGRPSAECGRRSWQQEMFEFDSSGGEFSRHCPERASTGKIKNNPPDPAAYAKLYSGTKSVTTLENLKECERRYTSKKVLFVGSDKTINEEHKRAFKAAGGKILHKKDLGAGPKEGLTQKGGSSLRIRIAKSPVVTDSSNEYETETGIPKSPTLFISGVSISRTPEPCSPASPHKPRKPNLSNLHGKINSYPLLNFVAASVDVEEKIFPPEQFDDHRFLSSARQSRSSSLTVPKTTNLDDHQRKKLNTSCGAIATPSGDRKRNSISAPDRKRSSSRGVAPDCDISAKDSEGVFNFGVCNHKNMSHCFFKTIPSMEEAVQKQEVESVAAEEEVSKKSGKSKSAAEPEREREMFKFPKSSTDGALSSVLHVQESNLSSDDFHEVLFLLERSPKHSSKRRKRSKKRSKEPTTKEDPNEVSSVL